MENDYDNGNLYYMGPINFSGGKTKRFFRAIKDIFLKFRNIHIFTGNSNKIYLFDEDDQAIPEIDSIDMDEKEYINAEIEYIGKYHGQENEKVSSTNHKTKIKGRFDKAKVSCSDGSKPFFWEGKSKNEMEVGCRIEDYEVESLKQSINKKKKRYNEEFEF